MKLAFDIDELSDYNLYFTCCGFQFVDIRIF